MAGFSYIVQELLFVKGNKEKSIHMYYVVDLFFLLLRKKNVVLK